ncbi:uncharacterized protein LOC144411634 [Styela clava]
MKFSFKCLVAMSRVSYNEIYKYSPPSWCKHLEKCPTHRAALALTPTPIHAWKVPGLPEDVKLFVKRDDMTGAALSGNKVRKLEFLLADAIQKGCGSVITCGALQSNHCRATAVAASQLGLETHLLLRSEEDVDAIKSSGNLFLSQMCNANVYLVPKRAKYETELKPRQEALAEAILKKTGKPAYPICVGGSDSVGLHGYLNAWNELLDQKVQDNFDDVIVTCGSGGTIAGISIGNYLTGGKLKIHAVAVCDDAAYFHGHINSMLEEIGLSSETCSEDIVDIIEGYKGAGYGISTPEDHELYRKLAAATGIFCDPVYSGKGIKGLISELNINRKRFKGDRFLFVHTGGIFGLYDERMFDFFEKDVNRIYDWKDIEKSANGFLES